MDIAFFTDSYLPTRDGVAVTVDGLARSLTRQGHQVHVYAPHAVRGEPTRESVEGGVRVVRFRSVPVPLYPQYSQPLFSSVLPLWARPAERVLSRADVVHVHSPGFIGSIGFLLARHLHAPLVGTFHTNLGAMQESVPSKWLIPTFFRLAWWYNVGLYWRCNITTAPTEAARSALLAHASKPFRRPIEVIPNGIDLDNFHPGLAVPDWRTRCGLPPRPLVTYLGRLTVDKGVHRFLDAIATAADLTDMVAIVGGTGPEDDGTRADRARCSSLRARTLRRAGGRGREGSAARPIVDLRASVDERYRQHRDARGHGLRDPLHRPGCRRARGDCPGRGHGATGRRSGPRGARSCDRHPGRSSRGAASHGRERPHVRSNDRLDRRDGSASVRTLPATDRSRGFAGTIRARLARGQGAGRRACRELPSPAAVAVGPLNPSLLA